MIRESSPFAPPHPPLLCHLHNETCPLIAKASATTASERTPLGIRTRVDETRLVLRDVNVLRDVGKECNVTRTDQVRPGRRNAGRCVL